MSLRFNSAHQRLWRCVFLATAFALFVAGNWMQSSAGQGRPMPDGPGKEEATKLCKGCHELEKSFSVRQDKAGWQTTLDKMVAYGLKAKDEDLNLVLDYVVKNYPADDVPKLNVNKAEAIDLESALSLKRSQAAAIIQYREKNGKFKSIEDLKKVPGLDPAKLEAKKDRLIFE